MKTNNLIKYQEEQEKLKCFISKKAQISYIQILILIISTFAFCYLIYDATKSVDAQALEGYSCCEETKDGNICQFVPNDECQAGFQSAPTKCKDTSFCKFGCCYSADTGWCNLNTPEKSCDGQWFDDASCNIAQCSRGCCVLGNNALWTTERNCEIESGFLGLEPDFRNEIENELECIFLAEKDDEGACILDESCIFTTNGECKNKNGDFYKNTFCSDSSLETDCIAQDHKACAEGEDSVYWFDSCGNKEDIAEECSLFAGTYCGLIGADYTCKSVDCKNTMNGKDYKNGESWCIYDGTVGDGKDVVGSRHVKHICFMGEERIEPCADFRNQICVGTETDLGNGDSFSEAACRINKWRECTDYNFENKANLAEKCNENPDCKIQGVHIDKFSFDMCVPDYPPGFDLRNDPENAQLVCGMASQKCTVIYVKRLSGWECKVNCGCEDAGFTQQMNDLCISLGDCGGYVNIAEKYTDDGYTSGAGKISGNQYKQYAKTNYNQEPAEPGNLSYLMGSSKEGEGEKDEYGFKKGLGVYGIGLALQTISWLVYSSAAVGVEYGLAGSVKEAFFSGGVDIAFEGGTWGAFGNAIGAAGAAMISASILSMAFGIDYGTALAVAGAIGVTYAVFIAGQTTIMGVLSVLSKLVPYLLIIWGVMKILGIGKTKKKIVEFKCLPWQAPTGGDDCSKCNVNDPLKTSCSDYRCQSLGQTCEFINKGTEQELCVDNSPTDVSSPRISPLFGIISEGYEYYDIQDNGFKLVDSSDKSCIPEFTQVEFGIQTDKPAQCKIGSDPVLTYEQMPDYFGGSNLYLTNHTNIMFMPSPEAFKNQYNLTDEQIKALGEVDFYVKCRSVNGAINSASYTIKTCVKPGDDLTAPYVARTSPENKGYIKYDATQQDLQIWVNEPAQCKYSITNQDYDLMGNSFECQQDLEDYGLYGWACDTTLTNVNINNVFYIRCKDISDNQNTMQESYVYELSKSASNLVIDEVRPVNGADIFSGVEPMTVNLQVKTSGGAEQGKAVCSYRFSDDSDYMIFFDTYSDYHEQVFSFIIRGTYNIDLFCEDAAGNTAESSTSFEVEIDTTGPRITRIYYDNGLKIITNEEAECRYSFSRKTNWDETEIMPGDGLEHTADWQLRTYYIQCKDEYENKGGKIRVKAYGLI